MRWHRALLARRHAAASRPKRPGRPRTVRSIRVLVLRLAQENPCWGYRRVHGELLVLGVKVAPSTVWEILREAGIDPSPQRNSSTWADFLRSQADALLACDFLETVTLSGARMYVLAVIEHGSRRIRILGATAHPTASWAAQVAKNLVMDLEDAGCRARYLIGTGTGSSLPCSTRSSRMRGSRLCSVASGCRELNSIMERWVQTCRRELLDRTLIWNQRHLLHALREFEQFYNSHRSHQGIANTRPLRPLPEPITDPGQIAHLDIRRHDRLGAASCTSTSMLLDLRGRGFRQAQGQSWRKYTAVGNLMQPRFLSVMRNRLTGRCDKPSSANRGYAAGAWLPVVRRVQSFPAATSGGFDSFSSCAGGGEAVGVGSGLDDGAVEGEPVDDGRAEAGVGEGGA
jgi:putative transposase